MTALDLAFAAYSPDELDDAVEIVGAAFDAARVPHGHPVRVAIASVLIRAVERRLETERAAGRTAQVIPFPKQPGRTIKMLAKSGVVSLPPMGDVPMQCRSPGGIDRRAFELALHDVEVANARMALADAESRRASTRDGHDSAAPYRDEYWRAHAASITAAERLAVVPAPTKGAFARKVAAIGKPRIGSDLDMFAAIRAGVAADADRLGVASPVRP